MAAKRKVSGRGAPGKPKSAAHKAAISKALLAHYRGKGRKKTGRKTTTTKKDGRANPTWRRGYKRRKARVTLGRPSKTTQKRRARSYKRTGKNIKQGRSVKRKTRKMFYGSK
jgi:hypothetical protein